MQSYCCSSISMQQTNSYYYCSLLISQSNKVIRVGGLFSFVQGGKFEQGFFSGMASSLTAPLSEGQSFGARVAFGAVVGGTIEEIGGGKFANGAVTGSFTVLFNELMHQSAINRVIREIDDYQDLRLNGRMHSSESEATRIAQYITSTLNKETNVFSLTDASGKYSYFLDSFYNSSEDGAMFNSYNKLKQGGCHINSATHYSIMQPTIRLTQNDIYAVSKTDFIAAQTYRIPITHHTIGFGQWNIDAYGFASRFIPYNFDNLGLYEYDFNNARSKK
jgi:hypothetical protein